ncbi:MAG: hypothetical protein ABSA40_00635 [Candidatus Dormibacteria bacterium]|jgi:dihydrofolate synthase/folylpolyglutamate synthase
MRRERIDADQAFFAERLSGRAGGRRRSLARARALAPHLGIDLAAWRSRADSVVTVVGSKGKGTAATFASATLAAAGLRIGTLTSPGLRSNRERIRVDGRAISPPEYAALVAAVSATVARVGADLPDDGYLSPSGLFTLSALRHFGDAGCDAVVLEAGMGGASDEVSLVAAGVAAISVIFGEHIGILGDSVAAIAAEKVGIVAAETRMVVALPQDDPAAEGAIADAVRARGCAHRLVGPAAPPVRAAVSAPGLGASSARLGVAAGLALLQLRDRPPPGGAALTAALQSVRLPGRLSRHHRPGQDWVVDCATNPAAIAAALDHATLSMGPPSSILTFIPSRRDAAPLLEALEGRPVVRVRGGPPTGVPGGGAAMHLEEVDLEGLGPRVLAVGPVYFAGELLALLEVDCERSFMPAPRRLAIARSPGRPGSRSGGPGS